MMRRVRGSLRAVAINLIHVFRCVCERDTVYLHGREFYLSVYSEIRRT